MINIKLGNIIVELKQIIKNRYIYDNIIVIYAIAFIDNLEIVKMSKKINCELVKTLQFLKNYVNSHIDIDFYKYLVDHDETVDIEDYDISDLDEKNYLNKSSDSRSSESSNNTNDLHNGSDESVNVNDTSDLILFDDYGYVNKNILKLSKYIFDLIDLDKDGFINATDVIKLIDIIKRHPLIFEFDIETIFAHLLTKYRKINFKTFYKFLV